MGRPTGPAAYTTTRSGLLGEATRLDRQEWGIQFAVTKFLAIGSQVPFFAAITLWGPKALIK
jgi:hypothetical protein